MIGWIVENTSTCGWRVMRDEVAPADGERVGDGPTERAVLRAVVDRVGGRWSRRGHAAPRSRLPARRRRLASSAVGLPRRVWPVSERNTSSSVGSRTVSVSGREAGARRACARRRARRGCRRRPQRHDVRRRRRRRTCRSCTARARARARSSSSAKPTSTIVAPSCDLSSAAVPLAITRPWSMTTMSFGQPVGFLEVLRREQQRRAVGDEVLDHAPEVGAPAGIEPRRGLVEEEDRSPRRSRCRVRASSAGRRPRRPRRARARRGRHPGSRRAPRGACARSSRERCADPPRAARAEPVRGRSRLRPRRLPPRSSRSRSRSATPRRDPRTAPSSRRSLRGDDVRLTRPS